MYEFAKQGREQAELIQLTRAALMAMNIGDLDIEQASRLLTSAILQLNMSAAESMVILDSWNEVSNRNAVSMYDLAEAWSHTASV